MEALTVCAVGLLLGMRHALEPDHVAAVSTLAMEQRAPRRALLLGASWGMGHTLALFAVGTGLALARTAMPERLADLFELGVAFMLVFLGLRAMTRAAGGLVHRHGDVPHVHLGKWTLAIRPLCVGIVHGLAGSGALTALVIATLPTTASRLAYIALFGLGSVAGMAALSGLAGWPLARIGRNSLASRALMSITGAASAVLGVFWGIPLAVRLLA